MTSHTQSIVVLTGAGVSRESGIKTFRETGGLWDDHSVDDVASIAGFRRDPGLVHRFYNERWQNLLDIQPNAAHVALAEFERDFAGEFLLVTQNVDDLHERAGSRNLLHMHGELLKNRCEHCKEVFERVGDITTESECSNCGREGGMRPHVVWFGEMPFHMNEIHTALANCDLFISIGTSGTVYPAADFYRAAKTGGAHTVELNIEASHGSFDHGMYGPATEVVPDFLSSGIGS